MFKKIRIGFGLLAGTALLCSMGTMNASIYSEKVRIPFEFHVQKMTLPAGEYRIEQPFGSTVASLVNVATGQRIQVLRSTGKHEYGKATLVFESAGGPYILKIVS